MAKVKSHKSKRGNKIVTVKQYNRDDDRRGRNITSSFLERIVESEDGGYAIVIQGKEYPYPFLPNEKVGGVIRGTNGSSGRYYNKHIRGKFF